MPTPWYLDVGTDSSSSNNSAADEHDYHALSSLHAALGALKMTESGDGRQLRQREHAMQMPGPWYFEVGTDSSSNSPTTVDELVDQDFALSSLHAALNSLNITESVEVPSSEHVAEIVGRQGM
jgi:hypothetical protein